MTSRPRQIAPGQIAPGQIAPAQTFCGATPLLPSGGSARSSEGSDVPAPSRLLLPPRLIVPASTTVKRSLWVFRTPKLALLKD
jgi:hypothetical protein